MQHRFECIRHQFCATRNFGPKIRTPHNFISVERSRRDEHFLHSNPLAAKRPARDDLFHQTLSATSSTLLCLVIRCYIFCSVLHYISHTISPSHPSFRSMDGTVINLVGIEKKRTDASQNGCNGREKTQKVQKMRWILHWQKMGMVRAL